MDTGIHGYMDTWIHGYRDTWIHGYKHTYIQGVEVHCEPFTTPSLFLFLTFCFYFYVYFFLSNLSLLLKSREYVRGFSFVNRIFASRTLCKLALHTPLPRSDHASSKGFVVGFLINSYTFIFIVLLRLFLFYVRQTLSRSKRVWTVRR